MQIQHQPGARDDSSGGMYSKIFPDDVLGHVGFDCQHSGDIILIVETPVFGKAFKINGLTQVVEDEIPSKSDRNIILNEFSNVI